MRNRIREARRTESGFTLIELLIVIVVLGILGGIVVFGVATFRSDANTSACNANAATINSAAQAYRASTGSYPATVTALQAAGYLQSVPTTFGTYSSGTGTASGC